MKSFDIDHFVSRAVMKASGAGRGVTLWYNTESMETVMTFTDEPGPGPVENWKVWGRVGKAQDAPELPPLFEAALIVARERATIERRSIEVWLTMDESYHLVAKGEPAPEGALVAKVDYSEIVEARNCDVQEGNSTGH